MKAGFLGRQAQPTPEVAAHVADATARPPGRQAADASAAAATAPATPERLAAGLAECMALLKGPSDERRCERSPFHTCTHNPHATAVRLLHSSPPSPLPPSR